MLLANSRVRVYACLTPVDMRCSFSGLSGLVRELLQEDPLSGHAFLFFNKRRNYVKVLWWDKSGYCLLGKKLVRGTFGKVEREHLTLGEVLQVLDGVELRKISHRQHFFYFPQ